METEIFELQPWIQYQNHYRAFWYYSVLELSKTFLCNFIVMKILVDCEFVIEGLRFDFYTKAEMQWKLFQNCLLKRKTEHLKRNYVFLNQPSSFHFALLCFNRTCL